jgi:hypothetical protein
MEKGNVAEAAREYLRRNKLKQYSSFQRIELEGITGEGGNWEPLESDRGRCCQFVNKENKPAWKRHCRGVLHVATVYGVDWIEMYAVALVISRMEGGKLYANGIN